MPPEAPVTPEIVTHAKLPGDLFIPDSAALPQALARTTHLAIGAHQDDVEFFAIHGILACFNQPDRWFTSITLTDGAGSVRSGPYASGQRQELAAQRAREQRAAALVGAYGAAVQLGISSASLKSDPGVAVEPLRRYLELCQPEVIYLHNPLDRHDTHVAACQRSLQALWELAGGATEGSWRPQQVHGCEVWRGLDWLPEDLRVALPAGSRPHLQAALSGVFDSQIAGGKRYDLAVAGRRRANATFHASHEADEEAGLVYALDLTPLVSAGPAALPALVKRACAGLQADALDRLART